MLVWDFWPQPHPLQQGLRLSVGEETDLQLSSFSRCIASTITVIASSYVCYPGIRGTSNLLADDPPLQVNKFLVNVPFA